ncbi:SUF system Fe-S cluster assembly regulator [Ignatzschineria cameli]|uniref:SUF system Fe-S cluster assembly regulator n=1 Tax=Ignatzschineria cameli TaxID=2182793 RepID=UPI000D611A22|nr:SUF system Fe-S cluster assembly regulator [Ignatzschineria cameli]PWD83428.1 SUF system Fe-S cluster assembly regulator [Ignatzschineria cameli]
MRITRETDYALLVLTKLAVREERMSASTLAEICDLNVSLVSKVLKLLVKAELLTSTRGVYGGYQLQKSPEEITLLDVIEAIEGPVAMNACNDLDNPCDKAIDCQLAPHWRVINQQLYKSFSEVTLLSLLGSPSDLKAEMNVIDLL